MNTVIIVSISVLGTIFMASFVALLLICRRNKCGNVDLKARRLNNDRKHFKRDVELIGARSASHSKDSLELGQCWPNDLPDMFLDPDWSGDAETLVSNCVNLLKACHQLTESLVVYTVEDTALTKSKHSMDKIVNTSKQIGPRVDDLVQAMYTPSNSKQIEEKCFALYLSVCHLLQVIKDASDKPAAFTWADDIIQSIVELVKAMGVENNNAPSSMTSSPNCSGCQESMISFANKAFCA